MLAQVTNATVVFGGLRALDDVTLSIPQGEIHALIGPNGAGKSTLVNSLTGYQRLTAGRIQIFGEDVRRLRPAAIARLGVRRTFQTPQLFSRFTVYQNVRVAAPNRKEAQRAIEGLMLGDASDVPAASLSYGQQRLLEVARALAGTPALLLIDEPAAGLAAAEIVLLEGALRDHVRRCDATVLLIEHNVAFVKQIANRVSVLHQGHLLASGAADFVLSDPAVIAAYLGSPPRSVEAA